MERKLKMKAWDNICADGEEVMRFPEGIGEEVMRFPEGIKWTRQRRSVYRVLWETSEPLSALQIYNLAARNADGEEYAVSTIYRILSAFEEKGFVEKSSWMGDGTAVYTLNRGGHTHYAVCLECRRRTPLRSCPFTHAHMSTEAEGFTVIGHKLELYGYCRACREAGKG